MQNFENLQHFFQVQPQLDSTQFQPNILSDVKTGYGTRHDTYNVCAIANAGQTEKTTFSCKDDISLHIYGTLQYKTDILSDFFLK